MRLFTRKNDTIKNDTPKIQKTAFCIIVPIDETTGQVRIGDETDVKAGQVAYLLSPTGEIIRTSIVTGTRRDAASLVIITRNSEYRLACDHANILG